MLGWDELVRRGREALAKDRSGLEELRGRVGPEDDACLLYTSGTTGPPKGVLLTHHNLLYEVTALDRLTGLPQGGSSVSYLPLAHIAERVLSIYGPLTRRSHVWFCPDPTQAVEYVREARPTLFFGVPRVWEKVRAGIQAKLAAEESPRKRKIAQRAVEAGLEVVRRAQRGEAVPFGLRAASKVSGTHVPRGLRFTLRPRRAVLRAGPSSLTTGGEILRTCQSSFPNNGGNASSATRRAKASPSRSASSDQCPTSAFSLSMRNAIPFR